MSDMAAAQTVAPQGADEAGSPLFTRGVQAGEVLKRAREDAGLHIAALAASMKVPVRKLEALESNRWSDLGDTTFARALASSVARQLKLNPAHILEIMPELKAVHLAPSSSLAPATSSSRIAGIGSDATRGGHGVLGWSVGGLLVAAAGLYFAPNLPWFTPVTEPVAASDPLHSVAQAVPVFEAAPLVNSVAGDAPLVVAAPQTDKTAVALQVDGSSAAAPTVAADVQGTSSSGMPGAPAADSILELKAVRETWVQVKDGMGRLRIERNLAVGESVGFAGNPPYVVVIGRADGAEVRVRGQQFDLAAHTRANVARFEVK